MPSVVWASLIARNWGSRGTEVITVRFWQIGRLQLTSPSVGTVMLQAGVDHGCRSRTVSLSHGGQASLCPFKRQKHAWPVVTCGWLFIGPQVRHQLSCMSCM